MSARTILKALCLPALLAISATQASAACVNPPLSVDAMVRFKSNPQALIAPDSDTRTVEATTRDLAGTDASLAEVLVLVAKGTTPRFQTAIAAGLAQAALACSTVDQNAAQLIQQAVAGFEDGQFQAAFAAVAGDLSTAATAAANAYASSGFGSVPVVNPNTGGKATTTPGGGGSLAALVLTTSGLSITNNTNDPNTPTTSATAASPVSATH